MQVLIRLLRIAAAYACACLAAGSTLIPILLAAGWFEDRASGIVGEAAPAFAGGMGEAALAFLAIIAFVSALIAVWAAPVSIVAIVVMEWSGSASRRLGAAFGAANGLASALWLGEAPSWVGPVSFVLSGAVAGWTYAAARFTWLAARPSALRPA